MSYNAKEPIHHERTLSYDNRCFTDYRLPYKCYLKNKQSHSSMTIGSNWRIFVNATLAF